MKRQGSRMMKAVGGKKSKRAVESKEEGGGVAAEVESLLWWAADEQMPWASAWSPLWDVDYVDKAYAALFGDVAWDDDIWNLKNVMVIPHQ
ncbi:uncharacterized protein LOC120149460 [Hibiscus syriacus]|uniref:uncharacterized protein LOC120149460 n=1 Tax=Hibiscus syriacus TaxID=106335 RepID=UPI001920BBDC|nr:uncharacterized protein LOC120149460 [Hibiscus syriacus]